MYDTIFLPVEDVRENEEPHMGSDCFGECDFLGNPEVDEYPTEDLVEVSSRAARSILHTLKADGEYARIPLWIALNHHDIVVEVFGDYLP